MVDWLIILAVFVIGFLIGDKHSVRCNGEHHRLPKDNQKGWYSPGEQYAQLVSEGKDGIGREHASLYATCEDCGKKYRVCRTHLP